MLQKYSGKHDGKDKNGYLPQLCLQKHVGESEGLNV